VAEETRPREQPAGAGAGASIDGAAAARDGAGADAGFSPETGPGPFDRDTAVEQISADGPQRVFAATVADGWKAGRGPHGGYLAAMLMRTLIASVADAERAPRSMTTHFARAPEPGPVQITTTVERAGRSLSTLSARMEQEGKLIALVLSAFSRAWSGPEIAEEPIPDVPPPDAERVPGRMRVLGAPPFTQHIVLQPRLGGVPFSGGEEAMEIGGWVGLAEARPLDALAIAFYADALIPSPFTRTRGPAPAPTIDLTVHFRTALTPARGVGQHELCLVRMRASTIHEGFFEEDGTIWAEDGTLLAHSRQLAILLDRPMG
jgi:acyl-CoA thioesterase